MFEGCKTDKESWFCGRSAAFILATNTTLDKAGGHLIDARIRVRLTPRAARDEIMDWQSDVLRVRVTAPPVEGRANAALERLLAKALGLPKSTVRVVSGERAREKTVAIEGASQDEVLARLRDASSL